MLLTDFCNRLATCAPRRTGRFPRWRPRFHAVATPDGANAPADDPGRDAFDDAPRAGFDHASRARRSGECGRHPILPSPRSKWGPTGGISRSAALSSTDESSVSTSDAPCRDTRGPVGPAARHRDRLPRLLVKGDGSERPRAPSIDECLLGRRTFARRPRTQTRHRSRDFAAPVRLPALFRPRFPKEGELDPAASGRSSRPGAHGHAPLVDFCNRNDPQARLRPSKPRSRSGRSAFAELHFRGRSTTEALESRANGTPVQRSGAEDSRVRGPFLGAAPPLGVCRPGLSPRDCSRRELHPDPIGLGHLLSHRPATLRLELPPCVPNGPTSRRRFFRRLALGAPRRAASRTPSRKEDAFRCTRGAFHRRRPPFGGGLSTACRQPVE